MPDAPRRRTKEAVLHHRIVVASLALSTATGCLLLKPRPPAPPPTRDLQPGQPGYVDPGPRLGPLHERYAGKVVYSARPIALDGTDDSSVYQSYTLGEPLYMRYWSASSPHNLLPRCPSPRTIIRADVDNAHAARLTSMLALGLYELDRDDLETYDAGSLSNDRDLAFTTRLALDPGHREVAGERVVREFAGSVVPLLTEGDHQLRMVVSIDCGSSDEHDPIVAEGTITVHVPPGAPAAFLRDYGPTLAPSPHPENAALVPEILAAMHAAPDWDNEDVLGAQVTSPAWIPVRNDDSGILVARMVDAAVIVHARKEPNPEVCRLFDLSFARDADGGPLVLRGVGSDTRVACSIAPR